ncbi:polysaccharide biosynthesis tyrosine autokinase [Klebsiella quasipneumoniae]|uniref:polysaccharide biosynthesis tyrosine autokinase n=1 Tax=Klebsiella quasipneumoniae TaxID=1463165 RepID=UPI001CA95503|nr:polysaccharide biosynthesis tyrosine autokinase [Klebsiella quasipneumoniae]MEB5816486.1 polysaccharide biosynthesis tyrosine autokinase [Klebsiella quasipneumoniae]UAD20248.1 polysaccharide biosynthesis tyrosine autokinase [Klebsiella quasipneumoniae]HBT4817009.1 polysaccharide biosynthesis tyrosine autokinase [Klebsiella quasipneumoniae subsp. quasipneumoniae]
MKLKDKQSNSISSKNDEIDLRKIIGTLIDDKWLIASIIGVFTAVSLIYTVIAQPIYRSDALVQVEKSPGVSSIIDGASDLFPQSDPTSATEIEIIKSRMVIGKAINDLGLENEVNRKSLPIIGGVWDRITGKTKKGISVELFKVPESEINKKFNISFTNGKDFVLSDEDKNILKGTIGKIAYNDKYSILITSGTVAEGDEYTLVKRHFLTTYNNLLTNFDVSDKGKDTGVLGMTYDNQDPDFASKVLNSITENYLLQNINRKTEQAQKSLDFLKEQLPKVRNQLDEYEQKLNGFRRQSSSVDLSLEAKSLLDNLVQLDAQINQLTFKETDIAQLFTKDHPSYKALLEKKAILEKEKLRLSKEVSQLPMTQQEIIRLSRDVDVQQQVYLQMLNKQQELGVIKASAIGYVRIIDQAMTRLSPVEPRKIIVILLGIFLGTLVAAAFSLVRKALHRGVDNPEMLEAAGIDVLASIPFSEWQRKELIKSNLTADGKIKLLASSNPSDLAIESIRSLRTSIHFSMMEAKNNILMISGVSPNIGKSFISSNLSAVLAQSGKRTLLIDSDLRKGYLHDVFNLQDNKVGLTEFLEGKINHKDIVQKIADVENLWVIPRGSIPENPSELLMKDRLKTLLEEVSQSFDVVIIDTPPILAVTDAAIIGLYSGTNLLVTRFEENSVKEVEVSIRRFAQNGIVIKGTILNAVLKRASSYYSYGYYEYEYKED